MEEFYKKLQKHLMDREGYREEVYLDSLGKPTSGIGHLLSAGENLEYKEGDVIPKEQIDTWFKKDVDTAVNAATNQARELGVDNEDFKVALTSVNYQLGTSWNKKFPSAYKALKEGNYEEAIKQINENSKGKPSAWREQTPTRVNDFQDAIKGLIPEQLSEQQKMMIQGNQVLSDEVAKGFSMDQVMHYGFGLSKELNKEGAK